MGAVVAHQLRRVSAAERLAPPELRRQGTDGGTSRSVTDRLQHSGVGLEPLQRLHGSLPEDADPEAEPRVDRAERAQHAGDEHEDRQVPPVPGVQLRAPLEDDERLGVGAAEIQHATRQHPAGDGPDKGAEGQLQRPTDGRHLLEHVENASYRRVEDHAHAARAAYGAGDPLRGREALLVDHEGRSPATGSFIVAWARCVDEARCWVDPHLCVGHCQTVRDEESQVAAHRHSRPFAPDRVARSVAQDRG
mmetsp:Transcript_53749/g.141712  ORF Transcript_53749/g.141712 Transcript_53749/m.141712 type:complete len:249 (-) Transcript_53749:325-1071(-)